MSEEVLDEGRLDTAYPDLAADVFVACDPNDDAWHFTHIGDLNTSGGTVGTTRADAIVRAAVLVAWGPLPAAVTAKLRARYAPFERVFHGVV